MRPLDEKQSGRARLSPARGGWPTANRDKIWKQQPQKPSDGLDVGRTEHASRNPPRPPRNGSLAVAALAAQHVKRAQHRPRIEERRIESVLFEGQPIRLGERRQIERNRGIGQHRKAGSEAFHFKRAFFDHRHLAGAVPFARATFRRSRLWLFCPIGVTSRVVMTMVMLVRATRVSLFLRRRSRTASALRGSQLAQRATAQGWTERRGGEQVGGNEETDH